MTKVSFNTPSAVISADVMWYHDRTDTATEGKARGGEQDQLGNDLASEPKRWLIMAHEQQAVCTSVISHGTLLSTRAESVLPDCAVSTSERSNELHEHALPMPMQTSLKDDYAVSVAKHTGSVALLAGLRGPQPACLCVSSFF